MLSTEETEVGAMHGVISRQWQPLFTTAGMVAFIISLLTGVTVAVAVGAATGLHILGSAGIGALVGILTEWALFEHQKSKWHQPSGQISDD